MNIKQEILLLVEEEEIDTPEKLKTAVQHGRVPGIKPDTKINNTVYNGVFYKLEDVPKQYKNAAIKLALKRIVVYDQGINNADAYLAYFNNRNKKEAKTTYKQLFNSFENGSIEDHDFEKKVNELFKDKLVGKEDVDKLYEDDNWLVVIPKTFAASCKYGEGTKWCTTSQKSYFERYSKKSPLIIIINKKQSSESNPLAKVQLNKATESYMDARDKEIKLSDFLSKLPVKIQEILKKQGFNKWDYVLIDAARDNKIEKVKKALSNGADIHIKDDYTLRYASNINNIKLIKLLLDNGADVHVDEDYLLRYSSHEGNTEVVKLSLDKGADVHAVDDAALRWACNNGHYEVVKLLIEKGARISANNDNALKWAAEENRFEVVKLLLDKGADAKSALKYIIEYKKAKNSEMAKLLRQYIKENKNDN